MPAPVVDRLPHLKSKAGGALYHAQHAALLASASLIVRAMHLVLDPGLTLPGRDAARRLSRRFDDLLRDDLQNVRAGYYPDDLLFQVPIGSYVSLAPYALRELPRFLSRGRRRAFDELPQGVDRDRYPHYYLRNFHWQTDGWLSSRSARLYDLGVEVLFGGGADVMRRQCIPPVVEGTRDLARPRVLDLGTGTGRFLLQLSRALPKAKLFGLDLSRPYLDHAGRHFPEDADVSLICENAERVPFADESFDAVTSIFLFHELPKDARDRIHDEAFRVLSPGRRYVVLDADQSPPDDEEGIGPYLDLFPRLYHEPYFRSYQQDPLEQALERAGFHVEDSRPCFLGKRVVAKKPRPS